MTITISDKIIKQKGLSKECETNNLRLLIGYLVHIFHFKNVHYIASLT